MSKKIKSVQDLRPDDRNANVGTARGRYLIEKSLEEAGAGRSIVVDANGKVIAGNKTLETWAEMGGEIEVVRSDGKRLVVVQREDLDLEDPTGIARKLALADNRTSEVDLSWNPEVLFQHAQDGLDLDSLWSERELERLIGDAVDLSLTWEKQSVEDANGTDSGNPTSATHTDAPGDATDAERKVSHVVMVQLFFNTETHPIFVRNAKALMEVYGTDNLTDLVGKVMQHAYDSLDA